MTKNMRIDPHVHFRDGKQSYKETIAHGMELAENQGVSAVFDMPNTDPPILRKIDVENRLKLVPEKYRNRYFLYLYQDLVENKLLKLGLSVEQINKLTFSNIKDIL